MAPRIITPVSGSDLPEKSRSKTPVKEQSLLDDGETGHPGDKKNGSKGTGDVCFYCKILLGVVLIFAFTLILYTWKRKEKKQR